MEKQDLLVSLTIDNDFPGKESHCNSFFLSRSERFNSVEMLRSFSRGLLRTKTIDSVFAVFSRLTNERLKINVFFHVCPRFDIETCKKSECDYLQSPTSHGSLQFGGKDCGQWNASLLNYLFHVGTAKSAGQSSMYVRFVSDDIVHGKGFNLSYVTGSCDGTQAK